MADEMHPSRRSFLHTALLAGIAVPVVGYGAARVRPARAELPEAEDGHAHDYVNNAQDAADHERYEEGQRCENCAFWIDEERNGWGACGHPDFQDVLVAAAGWCSAYHPEG